MGEGGRGQNLPFHFAFFFDGCGSSLKGKNLLVSKFFQEEIPSCMGVIAKGSKQEVTNCSSFKIFLEKYGGIPITLYG